MTVTTTSTVSPEAATVAAIRAFGDAVEHEHLSVLAHTMILRAGHQLVDAVLNAERARVRAAIREALGQ